MRDRVVGAVDRQRVLDQVVGADRQEIQPADEHADGENGGGDLDHAADFDAGIERNVLLAQALLGARDERQGLIDLRGGYQHRDQDADVAVVRCAQDGAQLRHEQPRLGEAKAHRAQAQRRVGGDARKPIQTFLLLVGAQVERANR